MNIEHPEDMKKITEEMEAEEATKKRKRKIVLLITIPAAVVGMAFFIGFGVPAIINGIGRAANQKPAEFSIVQENVTGEYSVVGNTYNAIWSGIVENRTDTAMQAYVVVNVEGYQKQNASFDCTTNFAMPHGRATYSILAALDFPPASYSISVAKAS